MTWSLSIRDHHNQFYNLGTQDLSEERPNPRKLSRIVTPHPPASRGTFSHVVTRCGRRGALHFHLVPALTRRLSGSVVQERLDRGIVGLAGAQQGQLVEGENFRRNDELRQAAALGEGEEVQP